MKAGRLRGVLLAAVLVAAAPPCVTNSLAQAELPRLGIITTGTASDPPDGGLRLKTIRRMLAAEGWKEGQNVELETRFARGDITRFAELAADLVRTKPDVIWADSAPALHATYAATQTIPIMAFDYTTDPVEAGYAKSYNHPGKNVTGVFLDAPQFSVKWIELLQAIVPGLTNIGVLWDPAPGDAHVRALEKVAPSFGVALEVLEIRNPQDIDAAASQFKTRPRALITLPSPMTLAEASKVVTLMESMRLPATSIFPIFAESGGLISYGPEHDAANEQAALLVTKLLRGANPGELPIERPDRFELVVNLRAANALGLAIPSDVLVRADRVIE